jgi:hypothetical protein
MKLRSKSFSHWLREPLVHFLVIGTLLFLIFRWRSGGGAGSDRIVVTSSQIDSMVLGFTSSQQRPPTRQELQALIEDRVREEVAAREATSMGLDQDDVVIMRRLRQKLEAMTDDAGDEPPPSDAELQAWMEQHSDQFRSEPQVAFRQVYLSPERHGAALDADAERLLARLTAGGSHVDIDTLGDPMILPKQFELSTRNDVARMLGAQFADQIMKAEPGRWTGPIRSGFGLHLVRVDQRQESRVAALADVRPAVESAFLQECQQRKLDAMYARLLSRYRVSVEKHDELPRSASSASEGAPEDPR